MFTDDLPPHLFILNEKKEVVPVRDVLAWAKTNTEARTVLRQTFFPELAGTIMISTVFTGVDATLFFRKEEAGEAPKPRVFETMIFGPLEADCSQWRYTSYEEAVRHHRKLVWKLTLAMLLGVWKPTEKGSRDDL